LLARICSMFFLFVLFSELFSCVCVCVESTGCCFQQRKRRRKKELHGAVARHNLSAQQQQNRGLVLIGREVLLRFIWRPFCLHNFGFCVDLRAR
jgi:hypothetical protein